MNISSKVLLSAPSTNVQNYSHESLTLHIYVWPVGLSKKRGGHHLVFSSLIKS